MFMLCVYIYRLFFYWWIPGQDKISWCVAVSHCGLLSGKLAVCTHGCEYMIRTKAFYLFCALSSLPSRFVLMGKVGWLPQVKPTATRVLLPWLLSYEARFT